MNKLQYNHLAAIVTGGNQLARLPNDNGGYLCCAIQETDGSFTTPQLVRIGTILPVLGFEGMQQALQMTVQMLQDGLDYSSQQKPGIETLSACPMGGIRYKKTTYSFWMAPNNEEIHEAISLVSAIYLEYGDYEKHMRDALDAEIERQPHYKRNSVLQAVFNRFVNTL
jgi:hypothetical protein